MVKKKKVSPLAKALLETAGDMRKAGLMDKATHEKITLRHLGATGAPKASRIAGSQIRAMRERMIVVGRDKPDERLATMTLSRSAALRFCDDMRQARDEAQQVFERDARLT
jgi:hypothetical protein